MKEFKDIRPKNHRILNHPYLALILLPLWCMVMASLIGGIVDGIATGYMDSYAGGIGTILAALLCLAIHKRWFRGEFDGNLKVRNFLLGLLLLSPTVIFLVINLWGVPYSTLTAGTVFNALCMGAAPGVLEEIAFRGLAGSNFLRVWKEEEKIPLAATLTAIVFGAVHLANIFAGAGVPASINQAVYAFGGGVLFAAAYFRTGSLLPSILIHTLIDTSAFLNPEMMNAGGVITESSFSWEMVITSLIGIGYGVLGYYFLRPAKRGEVLQLWSEKWTVPVSEELPADAQQGTLYDEE